MADAPKPECSAEARQALLDFREVKLLNNIQSRHQAEAANAVFALFDMELPEGEHVRVNKASEAYKDTAHSVRTFVEAINAMQHHVEHGNRPIDLNSVKSGTHADAKDEVLGLMTKLRAEVATSFPAEYIAATKSLGDGGTGTKEFMR